MRPFACAAGSESTRAPNTTSRTRPSSRAVRIVPRSCAWRHSSVAPASYEVTTDIAKVSAAEFPGALDNRTIGAAEDPIAIFHLEHTLEPGERISFYFVLTFSLEGEAAARPALASLPPCDDALERTQAHYCGDTGARTGHDARRAYQPWRTVGQGQYGALASTHESGLVLGQRPDSNDEERRARHVLVCDRGRLRRAMVRTRVAALVCKSSDRRGNGRRVVR